MPRVYQSFEVMKDHVDDILKAYSILRGSLSSNILSEEGIIQYQVYDTLAYCFEFSTNKAELIQEVAGEIRDLKTDYRRKSLFTGPTNDHIAENGRIAKLLRKYIRFNCERDLWENVPEIKEPFEI